MKPLEYFTNAELKRFGFCHVGEDCSVSRKCSFYEITDGYIGNHVRIDDFCTIKGRVHLDDYCHVCGYVLISGIHGNVYVGAFTALSARTSVYSGSDDYSADMLGGSDTANVYRRMVKGPVTFGIGVLVGAHSVILPNVKVGHGASIGAGCIINFDIPNGGMVRSSRPMLIVEKARDHERILNYASCILDKTS